MTSQAIYNWWFLWLGVGLTIVIAAAALLITIIVLARQIASLAATGLAVVEQIEQNTEPIWQLNATNHVAVQLLSGAQAIEGNALAIACALSAGEQRRAA
jgi:hypothetical protein